VASAKDPQLPLQLEQGQERQRQEQQQQQQQGDTGGVRQPGADPGADLRNLCAQAAMRRAENVQGSSVRGKEPASHHSSMAAKPKPQGQQGHNPAGTKDKKATEIIVIDSQE
jgi:hypothetical protein